MVRYITNIFVPFVAVMSSMCISAPAFAGFSGETVGLTREFPNIGTVITNGDEGTAVVGAGVEFSGVGVTDQEAFDISDGSVRYTRTGGVDYASDSFNGWHIRDALSSIDDIIGITNVSISNAAGFTAAGITFDADNIYLNFQGLLWSPNNVIEFDVQFADGTVPEPASLALLGLGLAGLAASRRRKLK